MDSFGALGVGIWVSDSGSRCQGRGQGRERLRMLVLSYISSSLSRDLSMLMLYPQTLLVILPLTS